VSRWSRPFGVWPSSTKSNEAHLLRARARDLFLVLMAACCRERGWKLVVRPTAGTRSIEDNPAPPSHKHKPDRTPRCPPPPLAVQHRHPQTSQKRGTRASGGRWWGGRPWVTGNEKRSNFEHAPPSTSWDVTGWTWGPVLVLVPCALAGMDRGAFAKKQIGPAARGLPAPLLVAPRFSVLGSGFLSPSCY
jgi:hypothetical protein